MYQLGVYPFDWHLLSTAIVLILPRSITSITSCLLYSIIRVSEFPKELRDVISEHFINSFNQLWLQLLKPIQFVPIQHLSEVIHIWEAARLEMQFLLDLYFVQSTVHYNYIIVATQLYIHLHPYIEI